MPNRFQTTLLRNSLSIQALVLLVGANAGAQAAPSAPPVPVIATTARGEMQVTPDRATVQLGLDTRGATAAAAAQANATRLTQVLNAVKSAGIAAAQIRTAGFNVYPEYAQERDKPPRVTGYRATNTVMVEVWEISQVGKILDTALAAGANTINSVGFFSSRLDEARRAALSRAIEVARLDAAAMAQAAGGALGALIELTSVEYNIPYPRAMVTGRMEMAQSAPTPIEPGEYTVSASVTARWQFAPGR